MTLKISDFPLLLILTLLFTGACKKVGVKIQSSQFRISQDKEIRENTMFTIIQSALDKNPGIKVIVNCGMNYAQKENLMDSNNIRMRSLFDEIFKEEMDVTYTSGAVHVSPGRQFDALITYPEISILKSLSEFSK